VGRGVGGFCFITWGGGSLGGVWGVGGGGTGGGGGGGGGLCEDYFIEWFLGGLGPAGRRSVVDGGGVLGCSLWVFLGCHGCWGDGLGKQLQGSYFFGGGFFGVGGGGSGYGGVGFLWFWVLVGVGCGGFGWGGFWVGGPFGGGFCFVGRRFLLSGGVFEGFLDCLGGGVRWGSWRGGVFPFGLGGFFFGVFFGEFFVGFF